jgi:hypothetical protein
MAALSGTPERGAPHEKGKDVVARRQRAIRPAGADAGIACVEREAPPAIQIHPLRALEVGSRVLGKWNAIGTRRLSHAGGADRR